MDLLLDLQYLIGVCDYERPLLGKVVIDIWDNLNCDVCLSRPWWSNNLSTEEKMCRNEA